jgi:hypothetical protein
VTQTFEDRLTPPGTPGLPDRFFDRFVFNLHRPDLDQPEGTVPSILFGLGEYPARDVVDGFVILVEATQQHNLRFATELSATGGGGAGPFAFQVIDPMRTWHVTLGPNPAGLEFDLTWSARAPAWSGAVLVRDGDRVVSSFEHLFQSGRYHGWLAVGGQREQIDGWYGQRDRSRGVRTISGGQGLHLWVQAQFPDRSVGFLMVEDREHALLLLEGAVMPEAGPLDPITGVRHALRFGAGLDLAGGTIEVTTASGMVYPIEVDASARGGFMAGGGYAGQHGQPHGRDHIECDVYPLDGSVSPRTLGTPLTDRLASFRWHATAGRGIFEFAHTRSRNYQYRPSMAEG